MGRSVNPAKDAANEAAKTANRDRKSCGLLDLEFAPDEATAARVTGEWGERGRMLAAYSVGLDALFIVVYVGVLVLGSRVAADGFAGLGWTAFATIAVLFGWAGVIAGIVDVFENWALIRMLDGQSGWPHITSILAKIKFWLAIPAALYLILGLAVLIVKSRFSQTKS
jgi:hypothetical protein